MDDILDRTGDWVLYKQLDGNRFPTGILNLLQETTGTVYELDNQFRVLSGRISPSGRYVAFTTWQPSYGALYMLNLVDQEVHLVSTNVVPGSVVWSPTGKRLAFSVQEENSSDPYSLKSVMSVDPINLESLREVIFDQCDQLVWKSDEKLIIQIQTRLVVADVVTEEMTSAQAIDIYLLAAQVGESVSKVGHSVSSLNLKLPFDQGQSWIVTRAYNEGTHVNKDLYALDFSQSGCEPYGKAVRAVAGGTVIAAQGSGGNTCGSGGYGQYVMIDHGSGYVSLYGHNSALAVTVGQKVCQGQLIAYVGNSGWACGTACPEHPGTHLHFRLTQNDIAVKPEPMDGITGFTKNMWYQSTNTGCASVPPNKSLILAPDGETYYWLQNNVIYHVASPDILNAMQNAGIPGWQWNSYTQVSTLSGYTLGPEFLLNFGKDSDGLLIQQPGSANVYLVQNGRKRLFNSPAAANWIYGKDWLSTDIIITASSLVSSLAIGLPIFEIGGGTDTETRTAMQGKYKENSGDSNCQAPFGGKGWPGPIYSSCLGFPIELVGTAVSSVSSLNGRYQKHGNESIALGTIENNPFGTFVVRGGIFREWKELGYGSSALGLPKTAEYSWNGFRRVDFEGGYIYWNTSSDAVFVEYYSEFTGISVMGPSTVNENSGGQFTAIAYWSDGSTSDVTSVADWTATCGAAISVTGGFLQTGSVNGDIACEIHASYSSASALIKNGPLSLGKNGPLGRSVRKVKYPDLTGHWSAVWICLRASGPPLLLLFLFPAS